LWDGIENIKILAKKSFVLRIDEEAYRSLEKWAMDEFRSVNSQIEWLVDKALRDAGRKKQEKKEDRKKED
jgi:hypothetical protein